LDLDPFMVAVDCVSTSTSRIKVYVRSAKTSFASIEAVMSLFEDSLKIVNGMRELRRLWSLIFSLGDDFCTAEELPQKLHATSGMLYYFEVNPKSRKINTKVYLPVKHYGRNDEAVALGLAQFLGDRGNHSEVIVGNYLRALQEICTYRRLGDACGLQTYISCSIKDDALDVTSYLSPEIFHHGR